MELDIDFSDIAKQFDEKEIKDKIRKSIKIMAFECEAEAKQIISGGAVNSGQFLNSIWTEIWEDGEEFGFTMHDGVSYGIYHEYGTIQHWVPFYYRGDTSKPVLADWAARVLGMTEEEMLARGGMMVQLDELMPFRKGLIHIENDAEKIFKKEFEK